MEGVCFLPLCKNLFGQVLSKYKESGASITNIIVG